MRFQLPVLVISLVIGFTWTTGWAEVDAETGLIKDDGWELVRVHCGACHSLQLVTAQRADRQSWLEIIRWMQATQNLWTFSADVEEEILGYLARNYPPQPERRRAPIPPELMPPKG